MFILIFLESKVKGGREGNTKMIKNEKMNKNILYVVSIRKVLKN